MYNPRKRVRPPSSSRTSGASVGNRCRCPARRRGLPENADALVHVVRSFTDRRFPTRQSRSIRGGMRGRWRTSSSWPTPVVRKRLERLAKDLKNQHGGPREGNRRFCCAASPTSRTAPPLRVAGAWRWTIGAAFAGFQFSRAQAAASSSSTSEESDLGAGLEHLLDRHGLSRRPRARSRAPWRCARRSSSRLPSSKPADAAAFLADLGLTASGLDRRHPRELRAARLHLVLHGRRGRVPRVVHSARHGGAGRGGEIHTDLSRGFIPRRSRGVRPPRGPWADGGVP